MEVLLLRDGDGYALRFTRRLEHSPARVWAAVTEPSELAQWFPGSPEIELWTGGNATFRDLKLDIDPELLPASGQVKEYDPPHRLVFTWGEDVLSFELAPTGYGCLLVFTHHFENRASAPRSAAGWHVCTDMLRRMLDAPAVDGGRAPDGAQTSGTGESDDSWGEYFARYTDEMGADGVLTRQGATARLRFERLLAAPVGDAWNAITEPQQLSRWLAEVDIELRHGGDVRLSFSTPPGYIVNGTVTRRDEPRVLEYTWTSPGEPKGTAKWQLIPVGQKCLLLFTHTLEGHWDEAGTLAAWHVHLGLLASSLAGHATWPFPEVRWAELHARYQESS